MVLIVDNYDSFVYNIVHFLELPREQFDVIRNDEVEIDNLTEWYDSIIISPGPMTPDKAGLSSEIIRRYYRQIPILGICLGMECIGTVFGAELKQCDKIMHGKADNIYLKESRIYEGLPGKIKAARYHSLYVPEEHLNSEIQVNARLADGMVMGVEHRKYSLYGVQFHPESILSIDCGKRILKNFCNIRYT